MPSVAYRTPTLPQTLRVLGAELRTPQADRFVAHGDTSLEHHFRNISVALAVSKIEPDGMADNLNRETVAMMMTGKIHGIIRSQIS
jgi:hypothetical protein